MTAENVKGGRLESLDVLRGFDMFFIFLPDPVPCIVFTFCVMMGWGHSAFAQQFDHCAWNGLRFYDCIFPLFLFISGVTFPFSYARQVARGMTRTQSVRKVLVRMFLLFLLGSMLWTTIDGVVEKNILSFEWSIPVNKPIWSSSFALVAGGISAALLALFYWVVDVKGWRRWGFFFKVIGMNAITIYLLMRTVFNWNFESAYFFGGICRSLSPETGAFVTQAGMIALGWLFLYWLYRRNIFLRV